jgi:hypothetical protein
MDFAPGNPNPHAGDGGVYVPPSQSESSVPVRTTTLKIVGITMGVLLLLGIAISAVVIAVLKQQPVKKRRRRSRPRYEVVDDDD